MPEHKISHLIATGIVKLLYIIKTQMFSGLKIKPMYLAKNFFLTLKHKQAYVSSRYQQYNVIMVIT